MPSVDLLSCLFRAVSTDAIRRLIFVGDPNQLPPIGPGRPFGELVEWLRSNAPQCVGELFTCMRTVELDGDETASPGLELASTYRDDAHPGDDAILARLAKRESLGDVEIDFWNSPADLHRLIRTKLKQHDSVEEGDYRSFNRSLGFDTEEWQKAESWQILSPTRGEPYGTTDLNRLIQKEFRGGMLAYARSAGTKRRERLARCERGGDAGSFECPTGIRRQAPPLSHQDVNAADALRPLCRGRAGALGP